MGCSGNMLEGTLPGDVMTAPKLMILDVSGKAGQTRGLRGQFPREASMASDLEHFMISCHNLSGTESAILNRESSDSNSCDSNRAIPRSLQALIRMAILNRFSAILL